MGMARTLRFLSLDHSTSDTHQVSASAYCIPAGAYSKIYSLSAYSDPAVRSNFYKSLLLNALSLASVYAFDVFLQPLASRNDPKWFHRNAGWFYQIMWLLPILGTSFYLNVSYSILDDLKRVLMMLGHLVFLDRKAYLYP